VDAYIGYEPISNFPAQEPGDTWYYQNALQIRGKSVSLHQSPVYCRDGELHWSESDGGSFSYSGTLTGGGSEEAVELKYVDCDYCTRGKSISGKFAARRLKFKRLSADAVQLGKIDYSKTTSPGSKTCPAR
jgi:hypothetical protein